MSAFQVFAILREILIRQCYIEGAEWRVFIHPMALTNVWSKSSRL